MSFSRIFLPLVIAMSTAACFGAQIDPELMKLLRRNSPGDVSIVVNLTDQYDLKGIENLNPTVQNRGALVAEVLEAYTTKSSAKVMSLIHNGTIRGVKEITPLWITNSLRMKASTQAVQKLMALNGIESINLDAPKEIDEQGEANGSLVNDAPSTGWGVEKVNAPSLWAEGIDGHGITVAMIDSGANLAHPDLVPNLWQNPGETGLDADGHDKATNGIDDDHNGYVDDVVGWNFEGKNNKPEDVQGHGSQTAGIVGGAGTGGTKTGVAPGAKLMILRSCCGTAIQIFESNTWEALEYATKNGARVISMSQSVKPTSNPSYAKWRRAGEVLLAAGVVQINSAGNMGSGAEPKNMGAPSTNPPPWKHPDQVDLSGFTATITIGATDKEDHLRAYSSTGPVTWEGIEGYKDFIFKTGEKRGLVKPDLCGPSETPSLSRNGAGYTVSFGGTSSATPHVAGVTALLLSAKPSLTVAQVAESLSNSAVPVENSFNNKCGAGRVDAAAAVAYAKSHF